LKNILLINPWIYDFAAYNLWFRPLGLLSLGAVLKQAGYQLTLLDCLGSNERDSWYGCGNFHKEFVPKPPMLQEVPRRYGRYGMPLDEFTARLGTMAPPDAVLVTSFMTYWYPGLFKVIEIVQEKFKGVPILAGGIYVSLCYGHAQANLGSGVELVAGPGEEQVLQILDRLTGRCSGSSLAGERWSEYPPPLFDLYDNPLYAGILTSRGCPYQCQYCASRLLYPAFEKKAPDQVIRDISHQVIGLGVKDIAFFDDALLHNPQEHFERILDGIIRRKLKCNFHLPNGIFPRPVTPGLAKKMNRAGFKTIRLSFESTSRQRQQESSSKVTNQDLAQAVHNFKLAGFNGQAIGVYVLSGLPGQPLVEVKDSIAFVNRLGTKVFLASYALIPGTPYYNRSIKEMGAPVDIDPLLHNNSVYPVWRQQYDWDAIYAIKNRVKELNNSLAS
jgi:radical SAM superfamily enzyme YgiQ (UPF0313 family)